MNNKLNRIDITEFKKKLFHTSENFSDINNQIQN